MSNATEIPTTYAEAQRAGWIDLDDRWQRGYVSVDDPCHIHIAGGSRRGEYYVLLHSSRSTQYCIRRYIRPATRAELDEARRARRTARARARARARIAEDRASLVADMRRAEAELIPAASNAADQISPWADAYNARYEATEAIIARIESGIMMSDADAATLRDSLMAHLREERTWYHLRPSITDLPVVGASRWDAATEMQRRRWRRIEARMRALRERYWAVARDVRQPHLIPINLTAPEHNAWGSTSRGCNAITPTEARDGMRERRDALREMDRRDTAWLCQIAGQHMQHAQQMRHRIRQYEATLGEGPHLAWQHSLCDDAIEASRQLEELARSLLDTYKR